MSVLRKRESTLEECIRDATAALEEARTSTDHSAIFRHLMDAEASIKDAVSAFARLDPEEAKP
jgi:hypothetical protein